MFLIVLYSRVAMPRETRPRARAAQQEVNGEDEQIIVADALVIKHKLREGGPCEPILVERPLWGGAGDTSPTLAYAFEL
jgi:hypothetical protein